MPTSPSRKPNAKAPPPPPASRIAHPLILMSAVAVLAVVVIALPASMAGRFLPRGVDLADYSGTIWHGSAGRVELEAVKVGAIEWRIHPSALLHLTLGADLHWVKAGFVADGTLNLTSHGIALRDIQGGGPIEDLHDLGVASGWSGTSDFRFKVLDVDFGTGSAAATAAILRAAVGDLNVSDLASRSVANGAALGGYTLHLADAAITPGADASAELHDTGGPLELQATVHLTADGRTGMLSGSVRARADAPTALRRELDGLAQLHARDAEGNVPIDLEFTF